MDQPSQQYPPWLTPVPSVITNAAGVPVETVTGVSYIAPTYYGPSIPLGSLYSYGGSTYPATVVWPSPGPSTSVGIPTTPTTTVTPGISTPVGTIATGLPSSTPVIITTSSGISIIPPTTTFMSIPTTATPIPTSTSVTSILPSLFSVLTSAPPLTSSSLTSVTSIPTSSFPSSAFTSLSSTPTTSSSSSQTSFSVSSSNSAGVPSPSASPSGISQAMGLTKGQLVGIVVASVLGLVFLFVLALFLFLWFKALKNRRQYASLSPIDSDYVFVSGSPRESGEEYDPFLRPRTDTSAVATTSRSRRDPATVNSNSSGSTNSHASGFGEVLDKPSLGYTPNIREEFRIGQRLSPAALESLRREDVLPEETEYNDGEYTGAYAYSSSYPALPQLDPSAALLLRSADHPERHSKLSLPVEPEEATVYTARRVRVEDLGPREPVDSSPSRRLSSNILNALGLGGLANLARKSWFRSFDSPRTGAASEEMEPLSEKDVEAGHEPLTSERATDSFGVRTRAIPLADSQDGTRPISRVSALSGASGATLYHDAQSSLGGGVIPVTPPPRAMTPVDHPALTEHIWASSPLAGPPVYEDRPPISSTPPRNNSQSSFELPIGVDFLDVPAPTALTRFASISSIKDNNSPSSFGTNQLLFPPPGLETIRAVGWADSLTESGSPGFLSGMHIPGPGDPDILEEGPPEAENRWRSIAADHTRRGTFGTYVQGYDFASERASLHSMHSSTRSSPSQNRVEIGSVSSARRSAHSRSTSSGMHSLLHHGSIPSDMKKRNGSPHSPALSVFGLRPPSRGSPGLDKSFDSTMIGTPPSVHVSPHKSSIASGSTTLLDTSRTWRGMPLTPPRSNSASPISANFQINSPPWAGGLAHDWQPTM